MNIASQVLNTLAARLCTVSRTRIIRPRIMWRPPSRRHRTTHRKRKAAKPRKPNSTTMRSGSEWTRVPVGWISTSVDPSPFPVNGCSRTNGKYKLQL